jgi:hypothetical protein
VPTAAERGWEHPTHTGHLRFVIIDAVVRTSRFEAGSTLYFIKPVDIEELMDAATELVVRSHARSLKRRDD